MIKRIAFDCEFTGLKKDTKLISIGLISDSGERFYAEFLDFYPESVINDTFIMNNVINNLIYIGLNDVNTFWSTKERNIEFEEIIENTNEKFSMVGTKLSVSKRLREWFNKFSNYEVELIVDCGHYDMVLLIDLFDNAFNLPSQITPAYIELNNEIARYFKITQKQAFDKNREDLLRQFNYTIHSDKKHNSLFDAITTIQIYGEINNIYNKYKFAK